MDMREKTQGKRVKNKSLLVLGLFPLLGIPMSESGIAGMTGFPVAIGKRGIDS